MEAMEYGTHAVCYADNRIALSERKEYGRESTPAI